MKNKTLSKIFAVTMATMTTFSLAACGGGGNTSRGDKVNLEGDLIGKYVQHQLAVMLGKTADAPSSRKEISMEDLLNAGF